ncbi:MAG: hypothetical protein WB789_07825 [Thermoplasmata archaeon]
MNLRSGDLHASVREPSARANLFPTEGGDRFPLEFDGDEVGPEFSLAPENLLSGLPGA